MRDEMIALLEKKDWDEIITRAVGDKKALRILLKLLYHPNDYIHWLAAEAIGKYGARLAADDPEKTRELVRRLLWNLNEECGASPWGSVEAIAAITAERSDLFSHYVSILFPFHEDDNLLPGVIWVQGQVGRQSPSSVAEYIPFLIAALEHSQATIRGYAAWALGEIRAYDAIQALGKLVGDNHPVSLYDRGGVYSSSTVGAVASASLDTLQNR